MRLFNDSSVIKSTTLSTLKSIQKAPQFSSFFLVGGTALALQLGHRLSIDLDFFTMEPFDTGLLIDRLVTKFKIQVNSITENTVLAVVEGVKSDFITHAYPLVDTLLEIDGLRLASLKDIAAMKLNAISLSGQWYKDFVDVFVLLECFSLNDILNAYTEKYQHSSAVIPLKAINYFDDLRFDIDPPVLNFTLTFEMVKMRMREAILNPDHIFDSTS